MKASCHLLRFCQPLLQLLLLLLFGLDLFVQFLSVRLSVFYLSFERFQLLLVCVEGLRSFLHALLQLLSELRLLLLKAQSDVFQLLLKALHLLILNVLSVRACLPQFFEVLIDLLGLHLLLHPDGCLYLPEYLLDPHPRPVQYKVEVLDLAILLGVHLDVTLHLLAVV